MPFIVFIHNGKKYEKTYKIYKGAETYKISKVYRKIWIPIKYPHSSNEYSTSTLDEREILKVNRPV